MNFRTFFITILIFLNAANASSIERRNKSDDEEISYFIYPLVYTIPGVGSGEGGGATAVNLLGNDSTLSLLRIRGEMDVDSVIATDIPIFTEHLTLSVAWANAKRAGFAFYGRGPDSPEEPEFTLKFEETIGRGIDLTLRFFDGQLELYSGYAYALPRLDLEQSDLGGDIDDLENLSEDEQEEYIATGVKYFYKYIGLVSIFVKRSGLYIDYTDDRIDPRKGVRFQYEQYGFEGEGLTNFIVNDFSLTAYMPNDYLSSVLVANLFISNSKVTRKMDPESDVFPYCQEDWEGESPVDGVSTETFCNGYRRGVEEYLETEANNSNSTSLGGPNRLRSYPVGRFHDTYSFFAGLEYRYYFLEHTTPFNLILEKGVFNAAQVALFYEVGQVSSKYDKSLVQDLKYSTGIGLRLVFSSVVMRADVATGAEGEEVTIFIGYGF